QMKQPLLQRPPSVSRRQWRCRLAARRRFSKKRRTAIPRRCRPACRAREETSPWRIESVAGEAEQMPSVVQELVHIHAADKRGRALLGPDEIERQKQEKAGEYCPGQNFADRDGRRQRRGKRPQCRVCHEYSPGITRPVRTSKLSRTASGSRRLKVEYGGATAPDSHRLPASRIHLHDRKRCLVLSNVEAKRRHHHTLGRARRASRRGGFSRDGAFRLLARAGRVERRGHRV